MKAGWKRGLQMQQIELEKELSAYLTELQAHRRALHRIPEVGEREYKRYDFRSH